MKKIILTTGGTGGHIFPALAVAQALKKHDQTMQILFIGSEYGPEMRMAQNEGLDFYGLPVRGFLGRGLHAIPAMFRLGWSLLAAIKKIKDFNPSVIAAFGGYASFAPALASLFTNVPLLLHEQNAIAGASNKILAKFAKRICVSMPDTKGFNNKIFFTGNPVRQEIINSQLRDDFGTKRRLLILGGSQGARGINKFIVSIASVLKENDIEIYHQTGPRDYDFVKSAYQQLNYEKSRISAFIDDMVEAYQWADLAFCRSGATTCAELCAIGLPAILVPFPAAIHDHQTINAMSLVKVGAAILAPEDGLDQVATAKIILELLTDQPRLRKMAKEAKNSGKPDAANLLVEQMLNIAKITT